MKRGLLKGFVLAVLMVVSVNLSAREVGNGKVVTKTIPVSEFTDISLSGDINFGSDMFGGLFSSGKDEKRKECLCDYEQSDGTASLRVTMDENLFEYLEIENIGHKLEIKAKKGRKITPTTLRIKATSRDLNSIAISNSMDFNVNGAFSTSKFAISLSGSGDVSLKGQSKINVFTIRISGSGDVEAKNLVCDTFDSKISGSGDIELKGKANTASCLVSGSGDISAYGFEVKNMTCRVSGSGNLDVYATEQLDAAVSGSGDISYKGNASVRKKVSGSGDITKAR